MITNASTGLYIRCEEKVELRTLYNEALKRRDKAVNDVLLVRGRVSQQEYDRIRVLADEARAALNHALLALEQHK